MTEDSPNDDRTDATDGGVNRRSVLGAASAGLSVVGLPGLSGTAQGRVVPPETNRLANAYNLRNTADSDYLQGTSLPNHPDNGDVGKFGDHRATYAKGLTLRHGSPDLGLPHPDAAETLIAALENGSPDAFDAIPTGGPRELVSPQAALRYEMSGLDPHQAEMPAAPSFTSDRMAANMAEVYWMALLRDGSSGSTTTPPSRRNRPRSRLLRTSATSPTSPGRRRAVTSPETPCSGSAPRAV